jgi:hypothetical protein
MVAGGRGDDAALFLLRRKLRERVTRAPFLETSGALQIVELAVNLQPVISLSAIDGGQGE